MMNPVYILSAAAISPQDTFDGDGIYETLIASNNLKLFVKEPDYRSYINPVAIRRMSRLIKRGISCGMKALSDAGIKTPDAIITGTGLGSMTDTERFLKDMIALREEALNPTFFIQSTYNSVNGWISLQTQSTGYNQTYVNRGLSTEMSLLDAQLFLQETSEAATVLVGTFDEMTDDYFVVKNKIDYWKKELIPSYELLKHNDTPGTIGGEGSAFFVLTNRTTNAIATLKGIKMLQQPTREIIAQEAIQLLQEHGLTWDEIDVVIMGNSGDSRFESLYSNALDCLSANTSLLAFKHLTGEYPTATSFAIWLSIQLFNYQRIPKNTLLQQGTATHYRNILILNHYPLNTASVLLLQKPA